MGIDLNQTFPSTKYYTYNPDTISTIQKNQSSPSSLEYIPDGYVHNISTTKVPSLTSIPINNDYDKFNAQPKNFNNQQTKVQKHFLKTYNELFKETGLPKKLKPKIEFYQIADLDMGYNTWNNKINIYQEDDMLTYFAVMGKDKALLKHEIQHMEQCYSMIRLLGADKYAQLLKELFQNESVLIGPNLTAFKKVEKIMGRLDINSAEGKKASEYVKALKEYTKPLAELSELKEAKGINKFKKWIKYKSAERLYKNNLLELDANKAAKIFKPKLSKQLKVMSQCIGLEITEQLKKCIKIVIK